LLIFKGAKYTTNHQAISGCFFKTFMSFLRFFLYHPFPRHLIISTIHSFLISRRIVISQANGPQKFNLPGIKHVIAVASGKGGVGKSTISANLALALSAQGHTVGLLDADIYGPSQGLMMGIPSGTKPEISGEFFQPIVANNVQMMSMSFVTSDRTPAVWRGPMASGALQQLLTQTYWQNVEYLIVDMPPGTGDIQLTMAQNVPMSGALIVTTPQDIALLDARKAIEMFKKVEVPLLGIVENMSTHTCSECGHKEAIFGSGGGESVAAEYDTQMLARLPLAMSIREQSDGGTPPVVADPDGEVSTIFKGIAKQIHEIKFSND
jgi:ATP-binding protein involved in chromosome partitioning